MNKKTLFSALITLFFIVFTATSYAGTTQTPNTPISDTVITTSILAQYQKNPLLMPAGIDVTTKNGKVTLSGTVNSNMQADQAVIIAEATDGVNKVDGSNLKVKDSTAPMTDTLITAQIKGLLLKYKIVNGDDASFWPIHVETKNGVVYLTGTVPNRPQKGDVIGIAKTVDGVKSVKSDLKVVKKNQ